MTPDHAGALAEGDAEAERLRDALATAQADLRLHVAALARLQNELMASRLEVAGARGAAVHLRGYVIQSQADVESAHAHIGNMAELHAQAAGREAALQAMVAALRTEVAGLRGSLSWRVTGPVRVAVRLLRRVLGSAGAPGTEAAPPPPLPPPPDPNAPYLFKPAPLPALGAGVVTVEELYSLSQSP